MGDAPWWLIAWWWLLSLPQRVRMALCAHDIDFAPADDVWLLRRAHEDAYEVRGICRKCGYVARLRVTGRQMTIIRRRA